ncbi:MFS transporter [Nocardioides zeae]|uniref:EmrB/QacA subfamily drug resistance transporter n=1 Tax=Nocardioides zeae TaxID=1457234 RepID=A0AAJ1U2C5_9ACTN|nr:MFS transporter [Nocardioides zeae]MDQ1104208.1 EmrB/QacA subfamily drug resistance transporter [Nocardioides zeae]
MTDTTPATSAEHGAGAAVETDDQEQPDPQRWRVLGVSLVVGFMVLLDVTIVNVAVPSMRSGLDAAPGAIQWVVSGYALAFGLTLVTGGRLGDAYGRRRLMVIGLLGFVASSAAAGLAPDATWLVVARLVQGASAGLLTPQNSGLIQTLFRGRERGVAFGTFGLVVSVSSALGPVLGGLIIAIAGTEDGWRWIFLVNVPIGLVLLVPILRLVPGRDPSAGTGRVHLDLLGAVLLGATVLAVLVPVVNVEGGTVTLLPLLVLVPVFALAFVRWEHRVVRRGGAPLLDVGLLRRTPGYASGVTIGALYFTGFTGVFLVLSFFLQEGRGLTALEAGLHLCTFAIGSAVAAPIAGRMVDRVGRVLTVGALVVLLGALVVLALVAPAGLPLWLALSVPLLVAGVGGGAVVSPNMTLSLADVPTRMGGAAGGALQTGQRIGAAIGAAVTMTAYQVAIERLDDPDQALRWGIGTSVALLLAALAAAVWSWRAEPHPGAEASPASSSR